MTGLYFCPTVGEVESAAGGGFDVCCSRPELHVQLPDTEATAAVSEALSEAKKREFALGQQLAAIREYLELSDDDGIRTRQHLLGKLDQAGVPSAIAAELGEGTVAAPATPASGSARSGWLDVAKETLLAAEARAKAETPTARELAESFAFATAALMPRAEPVFCHHPNKHVSWVTRSQAGWGTGRVFTATCPDCPARAEAAEVEPVLQPWLLNVNRCSEACAERHTVRPGCLLAPDFSKPILRADRPVPPSCGHEH